MVTRLDQFNMHDVLIHDFELAPFSLEEATDYLNFRMEMSDYMGPEVFTEERVEPWWRRSEGQLPQLHRQARQWLLESVTASRPGKSNGRPPLPVVHIVVVAVLLGVLLMVFVYSGDSDEKPAGETVSVPRDAQPVTLPGRDNRPEAAKAGDNAVVIGEEGDKVPSTSPEMPSVSPGTPEVKPDSGGSTASRTDPVENGSSTEETENEVTRSQSGAAAKSPAAASSSAPAPKASALPEIPEDEQVLLSWRPSDYTLQLLGASSRESVQRYLSEQPNRSQLLSFESRRQGEPWFVVVTGRYSSTEAAREAIAQLPAAQRNALAAAGAGYSG